MPLDMTALLRLKGTAEAALSQAGTGPTMAPALTSAYLSIRTRCLELVADTAAKEEFLALFPVMDPVTDYHVTRGMDPVQSTAIAEQARVRLAQLAGWLGAWPSAEALLAELVAALEVAEAQADEPSEKARLSALLDGLKGAGREIAITVVSAYLARVPL